ncbi:MAG: 50S ribosomal protein L16 [Planctomycetota bacterium]|jgi:large subunit ribosomal protein L16
MALMPKRVKFRKTQRRRIHGNATRGNSVEFGEVGLQALGPAYVSAQQIEAGRVAATRCLQHEGRVYIRIFPHKPVTGTPAETRMGKGKGEVDYWTAVVKKGTILFEIGGVPEDLARKALGRIAHKMPVKTRLATRRFSP